MMSCLCWDIWIKSLNNKSFARIKKVEIRLVLVIDNPYKLVFVLCIVRSLFLRFGILRLWLDVNDLCVVQSLQPQQQPQYRDVLDW